MGQNKQAGWVAVATAQPWRYGAIALLVLAIVGLGIFLRFYHLDYKVYWLDEIYTSLRLAGYTRAEYIQNLFTGDLVGVDALQHYQYPTAVKSWLDMVQSIAADEPQLTPLYFVLARFWVQGFGDSITAIRSFSAVIGLCLFPCMWWLCRELFRAPQIGSLAGWIAIAILSISPVHVLYAQEARPYSLLAVFTALSSAVLLWAMRTQTRSHWAIYGLTVALGLYTHLLFGLVAIAHGIYVGLMGYTGVDAIAPSKPPARPPRPTLFRLSPLSLSYLLATGVALLSSLPWLAILVRGFDRVDNISALSSQGRSASQLIDKWFLIINQAFLGASLDTTNGVLVCLVAVALYVLCRRSPRSVWLFILLLIGIPFLTLALPDLINGGGRSIRIRYLIPSYLGIQLALIYLFATQAIPAKTWAQKLCRMTLIVFLVASGVGCAVMSQSQLWWNKGIGRSAYYIPVAELINYAEQPLVISDRHPIDVLGLSHRLHPDVMFQLIEYPQQLTVAKGFSSIFLLNPSQRLRNKLIRQNYRLTLLYDDPTADDEGNNGGDNRYRLWRITLADGLESDDRAGKILTQTAAP